MNTNSVLCQFFVEKIQKSNHFDFIVLLITFFGVHQRLYTVLDGRVGTIHRLRPQTFQIFFFCENTGDTF